MAFKKYVSGAWQEAGTVKRYASGAWTACNNAYKYVNGAWTAVWNSAVYFLKSGVLQTGASLSGMGFRQGSGYIYLDADEDTGYQKGAIKLAITSDMVGKKLYVKASSNIYASTTTPHLVFSYPISTYGYKAVDMTTKNSDGFLVVTIPSDYYFNANNNSTTLYLTNDYGIPAESFYIYDVYIA